MAEVNVKKYLDLEGAKSFKTLLLAAAQEIADKIKSDIVDGAPEAYDTLKEVSEYIATHKDEYDALVALVGDKAAKADLTDAVNRIVALEGSVATLKADESTEGSVKAIAKGYADTVDAKVTTLNGEEATVGSVKNTAKSYADTAVDNAKTYADGLAKNYDAAGAADAVDAKVTINTNDISTLKTEVADLKAATVTSISPEEITAMFAKEAE